jgi:UMF1 family MFS transporter
MSNFNKKEWSWIFYDWANSAYGIIVVTAVLPIWVTTVTGNAGISATHASAYWGYANSIATLAAAVLAPILGALADYRGLKGRLFYAFTGLGILATLGLAIVPETAWHLLLAVFVLSFVGYSSANVFYDSYITDITTNDRMDRVSSAGYGFGYLGGLIPFAIFMVGRGFMSSFGSVVFAFVLSAVWWLVFTVPFMKNVRQEYALDIVDHPVRDSFKRLGQTIRRLPKYPKLMWFMLAYFFYIDGVNTIFTMASTFALAIGIPSGQLIVVLLYVQLIAFPFSLMFGWLANIFGNRKVLLGGMAIYILITLYAITITVPWEFWILATGVGAAQGGMQALSRSYLGQLVPKERSSEFFGFFNIFGKFSAIIGPALFGLVAQLTGKVQYAAGSLSVMFVVGMLLFLMIPKDQN